MNQRLVVTIALCLVSTAASAQRTTDLEKGVRVRITESHGHTVTGSFVASTSDSLTVIADGASALRSTPSGQITNVEVSTGRNRGQGAIIKGFRGLAIGIVSGAVIGAVSYSKPAPKTCTPSSNDIFGLGCALSNACLFACSRKETAGIGGFLGGAAGLVIGTVVGIATGHESWTSIPFR